MATAKKVQSSFDVQRIGGVTKVSFTLPDFPMEEHEPLDLQEQEARVINIIRSFSPVLIGSLARRMDACKRKLFQNLDSAYANEFGTQIFYHDGNRLRFFGVPSYHAMEECVEALEASRFSDVLHNPVWVDQILKALLNDPAPFQQHEDRNGFAYSQLISLLMELHLFRNCHE